MYRLTHVYVGLVAGLVIGGSGFRAVVCGVCGAIGGYLPDIDLHLSHRKTLHNIIAPAILALFIHILVELMGIDSSVRVAMNLALYSLVLGWILHILTDSLTVKGVFPLHPLSKFRLRLLKLRSNSVSVNLAVIIVASLVFVWWFERSGFKDIVDKLLSKLLNQP